MTTARQAARAVLWLVRLGRELGRRCAPPSGAAERRETRPLSPAMRIVLVNIALFLFSESLTDHRDVRDASERAA
jgi:hypothetical protein